MADFKKFEYLDSMRGIAILLVLFYHVSNMIGKEAFPYMPSFSLEIIYTFQYGVQLFFIVSAFTLMMSYDNRKEETQTTRKFFIRRFFRIAPMYYIAIIYTTLLIIGFDPLGYNWSDFPKKALISNIFFVNAMVPSSINNYVIGGWSISNEFLFYLCLPFICAKIKSLNGYLTFAIASVLLCSFLLIVLRGTAVDTNNFLTYYFFNQLPIFGLGMLAYWINKEASTAKIKPAVLLFLAMAIFIYTQIELPRPFLVSLVFFVILLALSRKPYKFLSNKVLANIGKVSFSIYLVHFPIMTMIGSYNLQDNIVNSKSAYFYYFAIFIVLSVISYAISCITYKYIEKGGQKIGRKIIARMS